jgi:hypothetical protein
VAGGEGFTAFARQSVEGGAALVQKHRCDRSWAQMPVIVWSSVQFPPVVQSTWGKPEEELPEDVQPATKSRMAHRIPLAYTSS